MKRTQEEDDDVIISAKIFAEHCFTCQICANFGRVCCDGALMLEDFHDALNKGGILVAFGVLDGRAG